MSASRPLAKAAVTAALLAVSIPAQAATDNSSETSDLKAPADAASTQSEVGLAGSVEIVSLFRSDCVPCRHELNILPSIAERHPDLLVTLLVLYDDGLVARQAGALRRPNLRIRTAHGTAEEIMARYGDDKRALPFSAALDGTGSICARHYGPLGLDLSDRWSRQC